MSFDRYTEMTESHSEMVKRQLEEYPLLLYSQVSCKNSRIVKDLLRKYSIKFEYFELEHMNNQSQISDTLATITGDCETPYLFINGKYYGGAKAISLGIRSGDINKELNLYR